MEWTRRNPNHRRAEKKRKRKHIQKDLGLVTHSRVCDYLSLAKKMNQGLWFPGWSGGNPFARNEVRVSKWVFFASLGCPAARVSKNWTFFAILHPRRQPFRTKLRFEYQKLGVFCEFGCSGGNAFALCVFFLVAFVCKSVFCLNAFVCQGVCVSKRLCVNASVCKREGFVCRSVGV